MYNESTQIKKDESILKDQEIQMLRSENFQLSNEIARLRHELAVAKASLEMAKGNANVITNPNDVKFGNKPVTNADIVMEAAQDSNFLYDVARVTDMSELEEQEPSKNRSAFL